MEAISLLLPASDILDYDFSSAVAANYSGSDLFILCLIIGLLMAT